MTRLPSPVSFLLALLLFGFAQLAAANVTLLTLATGLTNPVDIAHAGDSSGRLFIVEQTGDIRIIQNGALLPTPFISLQSVVNFGGERGLLGLAFHPQYASNGRFFVYYTSQAFPGIASGDVVIARYQRSAANPNIADPASAQIILSIPHSTFGNHNGGSLRFGPDGYLYAGVGDGGGGGDPFGSGQNRNSLLGKILRLDVNGATYAIPPTNPFIGIANVRPEIWAYGVRNPWRMSFDRLTGDFYLGDVGQGAREEVDRRVAGSAPGANFGWNIFEGFICFSSPATPPNCTTPPADYVPPILDYPRTEGQSITGGYVYRGTSAPDLTGRYVFGDFSSTRLWFSPGTLGESFTRLAGLSQAVSSFGEGENGELYLASYSSGTIFGFSSSTDTTPDAFAFFPVSGVAPSTVVVSNTVKITGLSVNASVSVVGGEYSIGCTGTFTSSVGTIANDATVCVRHTSGNAASANVTTTLNVGGVMANFISSTLPLALVAVKSRKTHGLAATYDLAVNAMVEPRTIGSGHRIVFQFNGPVTSVASVAVTPVGNASATASGNEVAVILSGIPDNQRVTVSLTGINGGATTAEASIGFAVGDINNTQSINASDISGLKARTGSIATGANFRFDLNLSGTIDATDISAVKARSGSVLP